MKLAIPALNSAISIVLIESPESGFPFDVAQVDLDSVSLVLITIIALIPSASLTHL